MGLSTLHGYYLLKQFTQNNSLPSCNHEVDDTINPEKDPQIHKVLKDLAARKDIVFQESLSNLLQSKDSVANAKALLFNQLKH